MLISVEETGKNQLETGQESMGGSTVLSLCFAKKSLTKTDRCAGAFSRSRNQMLVLHFLGRFLLSASLKRRRISLYINFPSAAIPVNYSSEFLEIFEATM